MKVVIICAGHGGGDSGAVGQGSTEAAETILITNKLYDLLAPDADILVERVPNELGLVESINWVNANYKNLVYDYNDYLCIEIHKNSTINAHGIETWYYGGDAASAELAQSIQTPLARYSGLPDRGIKPDTSNRFGRLGWIRDTDIPAVLIECGFISDGGDPLGAEPYATALYKALREGWAGLAPIPNPQPTPPPVPAPDVVDWTYRVVDNNNKQLGVYKLKQNAWAKYQSVQGAARIYDRSGTDLTADFVKEFTPVNPAPTQEPSVDPDIKEIKSLLQWLVDAFKKIFRIG